MGSAETLPSDEAQPSAASDSTEAVSVYAAVGAELIHFALDVPRAELTRRNSIVLPSRVQYAWPHASLPVLYICCADRTPGLDGDRFFVCAARIDENGDLSHLGEPAIVKSRPIHMTTDTPSRYVLTAYTHDPGLTIHEINADGSVGTEIPIPDDFDFGDYPHQIRVAPGNDRAILVTRGFPLLPGKEYHHGALKFLTYEDGRVTNLASINLEGSHGYERFNPRHLDFHPTLPLVFVATEHQNKLSVFRLEDETLDPEPLYTKEMLADPLDVKPRQLGGTVHVHPNGRFVYVANRNDSYEGLATGVRGYDPWITPDPVPVFGGGENSIAVFELDLETGEPKLIQNEDSRGLFPRCFALDPSGRVLIAGNLRPSVVRDGNGTHEVPAGLTVFTVADDGTLSFVARHDLDLGGETLWWMGVVGRDKYLARSASL